MDRVTSRGARLALLSLLIAVGVGVDALWIEPRVLLIEDEVRIPIDASPLRLVHLSDLHISSEMPLLDRLLARVAAGSPDLIVVSGDLIKDEPDHEVDLHTEAAAAFVSQLRRLAPVYAVQGHSDYQGEEIEALRRAGLTWLSNEGRLVGRGGTLLLLGVNQQVGADRLARDGPSPFRAVRLGGQWLHEARHGDSYRNFYSHYDPAPTSLADDAGPLAWSGYDAICDVRIDGRGVGAGIEVHSRYVLGEDRMIRLRRAPPENGNPGTFMLVAQGTAFTGGNGDGSTAGGAGEAGGGAGGVSGAGGVAGASRLDTGVEPEPGRWYRMRLHTEVEPGVVRAKARVWPAEEPEPRVWQAYAEDRSPDRIEAGTVGLWAWGGGTVLYRNLRVIGGDGQVRLDDPLAGPQRPRGWRDGARGTRLAMALARSPAAPPGTPRLVLSHTPEIVLEASQRGIDAVLAGHTHGGQVRLPGVGALTTRDSLGPYFDLGLFDFAAPNRRGLTSLYINSGVGTSLLPVRFLCPPRFAVIELGRGVHERLLRQVR